MQPQALVCVVLLLALLPAIFKYKFKRPAGASYRRRCRRNIDMALVRLRCCRRHWQGPQVNASTSSTLLNFIDT